MAKLKQQSTEAMAAPGGCNGQWWRQVKEMRSNGKDGRRREECAESATCNNEEGRVG